MGHSLFDLGHQLIMNIFLHEKSGPSTAHLCMYVWMCGVWMCVCGVQCVVCACGCVCVCGVCSVCVCMCVCMWMCVVCSVWCVHVVCVCMWMCVVCSVWCVHVCVVCVCVHMDVVCGVQCVDAHKHLRSSTVFNYYWFGKNVYNNIYTLCTCVCVRVCVHVCMPIHMATIHNILSLNFLLSFKMPFRKQAICALMWLASTSLNDRPTTAVLHQVDMLLSDLCSLTWPWLKKIASTTPSTTASRSAVLYTTTGDFPPSSRDSFLPLPAVLRRNVWPIWIETNDVISDQSEETPITQCRTNLTRYPQEEQRVFKESCHCHIFVIN